METQILQSIEPLKNQITILIDTYTGKKCSSFRRQASSLLKNFTKSLV